MNVLERVVKTGSRFSVPIPDFVLERLGLKESSEVDFFEVSEGVFLFTSRSKTTQLVSEALEKNGVDVKAMPSGFLSQRELVLLKKLEAVRFEERTPANVSKLLSKDEDSTLQSLMQKEVVRLYKGGKYEKTGVYSISKNFYSSPKTQAGELPSEPKPVQAQESKASVPAAPVPAARSDTGVPYLDKYGFIVVEGESEAKEISQKLEKQIKSGDVIGTRGFDKKFYVAKKWVYEQQSERVRKVLKGSVMSSAEVSRELRIGEGLAHAVLELMNEEGEVIEKKKGVYALA